MGLFSKPKALTELEINDIISRFVSAAVFCKNVGFTGVQFHAAHGYLLSQFLSPNINLRQDDYGGSVANRARLLLTIIEQARKSLGPEFPISVKLNSADFQRGGFSEEDAEYVILELERRGVDLLEISGGTYEQSAMLGVGMKESTRSREAYFLDFAKKIRAKCKMPLMVTGGFRTLAVCQEALENDDVDIIGFGRPFLVQEDFPKGFLNGTLDRVVDPTIKVLDKKNTDATEAGYYDILIERLARGQSIKAPVGLLASNLRIPLGEGSKAFKKWSRRLFG
jgi:2,4-dienoyl-CoA reductase-like NADH-dependent reductase (Old Yellow Enzyme family)